VRKVGWAIFLTEFGTPLNSNLGKRNYRVTTPEIIITRCLYQKLLPTKILIILILSLMIMNTSLGISISQGTPNSNSSQLWALTLLLISPKGTWTFSSKAKKFTGKTRTKCLSRGSETASRK
jgi:hypothetical protein